VKVLANWRRDVRLSSGSDTGCLRSPRNDTCLRSCCRSSSAPSAKASSSIGPRRRAWCVHSCRLPLPGARRHSRSCSRMRRRRSSLGRRTRWRHLR
jgi:hypothetical protein